MLPGDLQHLLRLSLGFLICTRWLGLFLFFATSLLTV